MEMMPREEADLFGMSSLDDGELIALLPDTGSRKESVMSLAASLPSACLGLWKMAGTPKEAQKPYGISDANRIGS